MNSQNNFLESRENANKNINTTNNNRSKSREEYYVSAIKQKGKTSSICTPICKTPMGKNLIKHCKS